MILHFCEKCGNRVPQSQIDSGAAVIMEEVRALCAGCSGKHPSRRVSQTKIAAAASNETAVRTSGLHVVPSARKSGPYVAPSPATGSGSHKAPTAGHLAKASAGASDFQSSSNKTLFFIGGGIALFLVVVAVIALSSTKDERRPTPKAQAPVTPVSQVTAPAPTRAAPFPSPVAPSPTPIAPSPTPVVPVTTTKNVEPPGNAATTTATDDGYDPRALVAASMLTEAKAQAVSDPWAGHDKLVDLKDRYGFTPSGKEAEKLLADWKPPLQIVPPGQDKPRLDGSTDTFLMLSDAYSWRCGYSGKAQEGRSFEGKPLRIRDRTFDKGIGFHSTGELNFDLGGHYKWLSGYLGVDAETNGGGSVGYQVWLNGRKAYDSNVIYGNNEAKFFKVPVDGISRVRIVVTDGDGNSNSDHADLCRLRVSVGPDEPRDDYTGVDAKPAMTASANPPAEAKPESQPTPVSDEMLAQQAYARFLTGFWGTVREKGWTMARSRLSDALKEPKLIAYGGDLKADGELLALAEKAWTAIPEGAAQLKDGRAFTLLQSDGKFYTVGEGTKTRVLKVSPSTIEIEQNEGRGKLVLGVACVKLAFESSRELARLGLPEDGEGKLALALMDWLRPDGRNTEQADGNAVKALSEAETNKASLTSVARMRAWLEVSAKERAAEGALKALEALIEQKKGKEALAAYEALKKDHLGTAFWANLQPDLPALDAKLKSFRRAEGLWVSYWSGGETNRFETFHFARAETDLLRDFGEGPPDPRVPADNFGLRMGGLLNIPAAGRYALKSHSDDVMKVWLDGNLITETQVNDKTAELDLQPGPHALKVEFMEYHGGAALHIWWRPPGAADFQAIPAELLQYLPDRKDEYQKP